MLRRVAESISNELRSNIDAANPKGTLKIRSTDPSQDPAIDPKYLTHEEDVVDQRNAWRLGVEILETQPLAEYRDKPLNFRPDMSDAEVDQWIQKESHSGYCDYLSIFRLGVPAKPERAPFLRRGQLYHSAGMERKCSVLWVYIFCAAQSRREISQSRPIDSPSSPSYHLSCTCKMGKVVDPKTAQVYGMENLRIVDASIMPSMTSGNLNAPTIMLAEKMADAILGKDPLPKDESVKWFKADRKVQRSM